MHNRARMTVASFLTKDLYVDWRAGAWHFWDLLSDGEIANNAGNWQWVAGTGNDTRPNRVLNPVRQAERFDPARAYVRRYLPQLEQVRGKAIFRPWRMEGFGKLDYPQPLVDDARRRPPSSPPRRRVGSADRTPGGHPRQQRARPRRARRSRRRRPARGGDRAAPRRARRRLRPPPRDRPRRQPAAAGRQDCTECWRSARSAAQPRAAGRQPALPRRLHRPRDRPLGLRRRPRPSAPGFDPRWRGEVIEAWPGRWSGPRDGGVYWQTRGPRFETPAEIRLIAAHADVVRTTIASECIVAGQLGLDYAALCVVDNLANGVGAGELDVAAPRGRPHRQRDPPARRPGGGAAAARCGRPVNGLSTFSVDSRITRLAGEQWR